MLFYTLVLAAGLRVVPSSPTTIARSVLRDLTRVVGAASVTGVSLSRVALASDSLIFPVDCSDSVAVLRGPGGREVVIVGTAHISEESVEVVKRTINGVKPDVVMIELDVKRLGKVSEADMAQKGFILPSAVEVNVPIPEVVVASDGATPVAALSPPSTPIPNKRKRIGNSVQGFMSSMRQGAASLAGNALKKGLGSFYDSVEKLGFTAGGEFQAAIQEAFAMHTPVLLGDQDVDTTLQNLAAALSKTNTDSFLKLIDDLDAAERELGIELPSDPDAQMTRDQMAGFVEKLKTRRALDLVMGTLQKEAPLIYQAMIGDRDAYMANSITGQANSRVMVAVVGMAHLSGIERNLATKGFSVVSRKC